MARRTNSANRRWLDRAPAGRRPTGGPTPQTPQSQEPHDRTRESGAGPYEWSYDITHGYDSGRSIVLP
jgi:hypothetical protein